MSGDKLKALRQWERTTLEMDKQLSGFEQLFGFTECPFIDAVYDLQLKYTKAVAKNIGDEWAWLVWYQLDNGMGEKCLAAGYGDEMRKIKTLEDLLWLIEG